MGDRANVKVTGGMGTTYLYTHWGGTNLPAVVQRALAKHWRWNDQSYLTRIIFCEMVKGSETDETGFGIAQKCGDGDERIVEVDTFTQTVEFNGEIISFRQFIELDPSTLTWREFT